jgi:hypothetical protein
MSTGELRVDGNRAVYELSMPVYELVHVKDPRSELLGAMKFGDGKLVSSSCQEQGDNLICTGNYEFPAAFDRIAIECRLPAITVPNHVHLLRAKQGPYFAQAVFDGSFPKSEIRFRPPSEAERIAEAATQGVWRSVAGWVPLLFLAVLALAARSSREAFAMAAALVAGECLSAVVEPLISRPLSPRFLEAAAALTIAYVAIDTALLPKARWRWLIAGALGLFYGFYFARFAAAGELRAVPFFAGLFVAQAALTAAFYFAARRLPAPLHSAAIWTAFAVAMGWFGWRLLG